MVPSSRARPATSDVPLDRERQDRQSVVVGMLPDEVHAAGRAREHGSPRSGQHGDEGARPVVRRRAHDARRARKKARRSSRDAAAATPGVTAMRWFSRRSLGRSYSDPAAPALGSGQP